MATQPDSFDWQGPRIDFGYLSLILNRNIDKYQVYVDEVCYATSLATYFGAEKRFSVDIKDPRLVNALSPISYPRIWRDASQIEISYPIELEMYTLRELRIDSFDLDKNLTSFLAKIDLTVEGITPPIAFQTLGELMRISQEEKRITVNPSVPLTSVYIQSKAESPRNETFGELIDRILVQLRSLVNVSGNEVAVIEKGLESRPEQKSAAAFETKIASAPHSESFEIVPLSDGLEFRIQTAVFGFPFSTAYNLHGQPTLDLSIRDDGLLEFICNWRLADLSLYFHEISFDEPFLELETFWIPSANLYLSSGGTRIAVNIEFLKSTVDGAMLAMFSRVADFVAGRGWEVDFNPDFFGLRIASSMENRHFSLTAAYTIVREIAFDVDRYIQATGGISIDHGALSAFFDLPVEIRTACQQYLLYFAEFLSNIGIEASTQIQNQSGRILFSVTPTDDKVEILDRIRAALVLYLDISNTDASLRAQGMEARSLMHEIETLKSRLNMKSIELDAAELKNFQLREALDTSREFGDWLKTQLLDLKKQTTLPAAENAGSEKKAFGLQKVKKLEGFGIHLDLDEAFKAFRRRDSIISILDTGEGSDV